MKHLLIPTLLLLIINTGYAQFGRTGGPIVNPKISIIQNGSKFCIVKGAKDTLYSNLDTAYYANSKSLCFLKKNNLCGLISDFGSELIPIRYDKIQRIFNEFWLVEKEHQKNVYSLGYGAVFKNTYDDIVFSRRYGHEFIVKKDNKKGVYSSTGVEVIPVKYDEIENQSYFFILTSNNTTKHYFSKQNSIDSIAIKDDFFIEENWYSVFTKNGKDGIINQSGDILIPPVYNEMKYYSALTPQNDRHLFISKKDGLYGAIDLNQNSIIPFVYKRIDIIDSTHAIVKKENKLFFYDFSKNIERTNVAFDSYVAISGKYLRIENEGKETYVKAYDDFNLLLPLEYNKVFLYNDIDRFVVERGLKYGLVDEKNNILIPIEYDELSLACNKAVARKNKKYGVLSFDNKVLLPFEYNDLTGYAKSIENLYTHQVFDCDLKCISNCK